MFRKWVITVAAAVLILSGCGPQREERLRICAGKPDVGQALGSLRSRAERAVELEAKGQCRLRVHLGDKPKPHKENFPVRIWFSPPCQVRLQGNIAFDPRGIELGSNEDEFWLAIRPKELRRYLWGKWEEQGDLNRVEMRPDVLLESLGVVSPGGEAEVGWWSLSQEGAYDILTRRGVEGEVDKKVYVYNCGYSVSRIEYYDGDGNVATAAELSKYKEVAAGFSVPSFIRIVTHGKNNRENSVRINLGSVRSVSFDEKKRKALFRRRMPRGFERVERVVNGEVIEQVP
ncbi:MAG: hypothetical protein ACYS76_16380 [Planctomycetota bacterium]